MNQDLILSHLNPKQKEAVTWPDEPLLILAGAGSGKTRILTHRMAYLISRGVPAFQILGVTFTNKAAQEMKSRVQKLVSQDVWISTFHATCLRILRINGAALGIDPRFIIYDDDDQLTLIKECVKELNLDEKQVHPKGVRERIQRAKDYLETAYQYAEKSGDFYEETVAKVYRLYEEKLARLKGLDFGDLIMKTVCLFDQHPDILTTWQDRFQHILIDEYQDTNHAQYRFVKLLASRSRQITVVGDPDQSIYAWRGANIKNILNFESDYPHCAVIKMEQNYRSSPVILDAANGLIQRNQMRKHKALWTERRGGEKIALYEALDEKEEALYVVNQVLKYKEQGKTLADQVVFYRVHAQSRVLEDVLRRAKIPYKIVGGVRFYDRREIKDLIAYLRAVACPHDDISLKRIVNVPARGIGKKTVDLLAEKAKETGKSFDEVLRLSGSLEVLSPKARKTLAAFSEFLAGLRAQESGMNVAELLETILKRTGYVRELENEKTSEAQARIENIEEFFSVIGDFEDENPEGSASGGLLAFLESISLMTDLDAWDNGTNLLTMMTFHTAKGLEFPVVYMVGMEEGIFPNINSFTDSPEELEEERRLCYVGLTRAKDKVHLLYTRQRRLYGSLQHNLPSRFLNEIPSALYETMPCKDNSFDPDDVLLEDDIVIDVDKNEIRRRILFD